MVNDINELESKCGKILGILNKKSKFSEVHEFWENNKNDFYVTIRSWRDNTSSNILIFVKEYSSLLLRFLITGSPYSGNVKTDLERIYGNFIKNIGNFGGKYIIDSYLKISDYNNVEQLKYDEIYLDRNIKKAIEEGISEKTISALAKNYINKSVIVGIFDNPNECKLWGYLSSQDKNDILEIYNESINLPSNIETPHKTKLDIEVAGFYNKVGDNEIEENNDFEQFENNEDFETENAIENVEPDMSEIIDNKYADDLIEDEVEEDLGTENKPLESNVVIEPEVFGSPENVVEDGEPVLDIVGNKNGIKIVIISSDTQMDNVRRAFTQEWLDKQYDSKKWKFHIDFRKDFVLLDGWKDAPKTSIKTIAKYDLIIIGQNDHLLKDMPKEYTDGGKKEGGIKKCLQDMYNLGDGHVYFPEKNKRPDLSVTNLRFCLYDFMDRLSR